MNNLLNFKSFLKFLGRNKAYTLIDVFGLSVSLMFVLLIAVYTVQEMSTDKFHTKADRIYLVGNENWMATGAAIPYKIKERYPEVEKVCPVVADNSSNIVVVSGDRKLKANVMFADSTFFDFFDFRLINFPISGCYKALVSKRWPPGTMRWSPLRSPVRCSERMIRWDGS